MEHKGRCFSTAICIFFTAVPLLAQDISRTELPPLLPRLNIFLFDQPPNNPESRLQEVILCIEAETEIFYKLNLDDQMVAVGMLKRGTNQIPIPLEMLFLPSQVYTYDLETRWKESFQHRRIEISVITSGPSGGYQEERIHVPIPSFLSLYIEGRLLYQEKKESKSPLSEKKIRSMPATSPIPHVWQRSYPDTSSSAVSITGLAAAAWAYIKQKKMDKKLKAYAAEMGKKQVLQWELKKKEPDGTVQNMAVQIRLQVKPGDASFKNKGFQKEQGS